jgi:AcrR family transcriptional regulator
MLFLEWVIFFKAIVEEAKVSKERGESAAKRRILETASKLFYRDGIRATGIDAVVEQSGVARMTLYHHFPTKEALIEATITEFAAKTREMVDAIVADCSMKPRARLLKLFAAMTTPTCGDEFRGCPLVNAVVESPDHTSKPFCAAVSAKRTVSDAFEQLAREDGVVDPEMLAEQLMLLAEGTIVRAQMGCGAKPSAAALAAAESLVNAA